VAFQGQGVQILRGACPVVILEVMIPRIAINGAWWFISGTKGSCSVMAAGGRGGTSVQLCRHEGYNDRTTRGTKPLLVLVEVC
jgi:hypothetical protein